MVERATNNRFSLDRILAAAQLPALPHSAIRLLELSRNPKNGPVEFAIPIEADPELASQVLRFVNSAYFGFSREISNVKLAISMVGIRTIKNCALWSAVLNLMPSPRCGPFDLKILWQDSLRRGLFARSFGKILGMHEAEEPFAAALLQDMAVPLLAKELTSQYISLLELRQGGKVRLSRLEQDRFGWTHAEAAACMARQWNLSEEFAQLVQRHAACEEMIGTDGIPLGQLAVAVSALLPTGSDEIWHDCGQFERSYLALRPARGPSAAELLERIDQEFRDFAPVLKISIPVKSLVESYAEACQLSV